MQKLLQFIENTISLTVLVAIVATSLLVTLALSPVPAEEDNQVASLSTTGEVLSNPIPLQVADRHIASLDYRTQLISTGNNTYKYYGIVSARDVGNVTKDFVNLSNQNFGDAVANISVVVPEELQDKVVISVIDAEKQIQVYNPTTIGAQSTKIKVPQNSSKDLGVFFTYLADINFEAQFTFSISTEF
jgi:hypothetical protein